MTTQLHTHIFRWWREQGRVLPWREKEQASKGVREVAFQHYFAHHLRRDPYQIVVSEMMLQQTQVDRVLPKYEAWMKKWPRIEDLAGATLAEVLIFWQGLGYNRRARFLWLLAKEIVEKKAGVWPTAEEELRELPGIGKYTARAIQAFAFGQHVGVVDTNVKRILDRVFAKKNLAQKKKSENYYFQLADEILPAGQADPWNQALMDFGALICTSRGPKCGVCPLQKICQANLESQTVGFENYAAYLKQLEKPVIRKKPQKFKDTDRYFRGRILDELRRQKFSPAALSRVLEQEYGLSDQKKFQTLLLDLEKEGLLKNVRGQISLG